MRWARGAPSQSRQPAASRASRPLTRSSQPAVSGSLNQVGFGRDWLKQSSLVCQPLDDHPEQLAHPAQATQVAMVADKGVSTRRRIVQRARRDAGRRIAERAWQNGQAGTPDTKLGEGRLGCGEAPRPPWRPAARD